MPQAILKMSLPKPAVEAGSSAPTILCGLICPHNGVCPTICFLTASARKSHRHHREGRGGCVRLKG